MPRLCPFVLSSIFSFTLFFSTAIVAKFVHIADASQQNMEHFLRVFELLRCLVGRSESRVSRARVLHNAYRLVIGKLKTLGAPALPSVANLVQPVVPGSNWSMCRASAVREKHKAKSNERKFWVVVAVMARPDEQPQQCLLRRMFKALVEV